MAAARLSGSLRADQATHASNQVVPADLNDAPAGIKPEDQYDNLCELPGPTGVIDAKALLGALLRLVHSRSLARSISPRARGAILL